MWSTTDMMEAKQRPAKRNVTSSNHILSTYFTFVNDLCIYLNLELRHMKSQQTALLCSLVVIHVPLIYYEESCWVLFHHDQTAAAIISSPFQLTVWFEDVISYTKIQKTLAVEQSLGEIWAFTRLALP